MVTSANSVGSLAEDPLQKKRLDPVSSLSVLPDDITLSILARMPRSYHPVISLVSKTFRRLIASPELYVERSVLRRTEHILYVVLRSHATETPRWYTLNHKLFGNESEATEMGINYPLVSIPSFPPVPCWGMSIVAVGSKIYVLGGCINDELVSTGFVIECPSHTCRYLPSMKQARGCAAAGLLNGKIYVVGGCDHLSSNWVEAFDLKTETWESVSGVYNAELHKLTIQSFVIDDKIYIMDRNKSFVYDPKEGRLESDEVLDLEWSVRSCVIDDRLYSFGMNYKIFVFDPIAREWNPLKGLEDRPQGQDGSRLVNHGGKLVILCNERRSATEIWCTEIELEKREGGEVWGKILRSDLVLTGKDYSTIARCVTVAI